MSKNQWIKLLLICLISSIIKSLIPSNFEWYLGYLTGLIVWETIGGDENE